MYNIITEITVINVWAPKNCNAKKTMTVCIKRQIDVYNPVFLFVTTKLTFGILRMSGKS